MPILKQELKKLLKRELNILTVKRVNLSVSTICKMSISKLRLKRENNTTSLLILKANQEISLITLKPEDHSAPHNDLE